MGFRRRTRRRALIAGAAVGGMAAHHAATAGGQQQQVDEAPVEDPQVQYAPPPVDSADEIEHLAQLHASGALTDEEFAAAKAKALGI
jgi:putative oligomerization/nucleic acid binding protein